MDTLKRREKREAQVNHVTRVTEKKRERKRLFDAEMLDAPSEMHCATKKL